MTTQTETFYRTYRFRRSEKDPVIDQVHTIMGDTGYSTKDVVEGSGVSPTTLRNWFDGDTKRPQYATLCAAVRSMGYDFALVATKNKANGHPWKASGPKIVKRFPAHNSNRI